MPMWVCVSPCVCFTYKLQFISLQEVCNVCWAWESEILAYKWGGGGGVLDRDR